MSQQTFFDANVALAQTLAGTAGLTASRIYERDYSVVVTPGPVEPALVLMVGDGTPDFDYFPVAAGPVGSGVWTAVWCAYLPFDGAATTPTARVAWTARWEALVEAVKAKLTNPQALIAPTRPLAHQVRWGDEPPLLLQRQQQAPAGAELWFTVQQEEL